MFVELKKFFNLKSTLVQYTLVLSIFLLVSAIELAINDSSVKTPLIINFFSIYISSLVLFLITTKVLKFKGANYFNYSITTIILYLLIHPTTAWWIFPIAIVMTVAAKYIFRYRQLPIFNPAAMGLFLTYCLSVLLHKMGFIHETLFVSWWGAELNRTSYAQSPALYILPAIFVVLLLYFSHKYKKLLHGAVFLITYLLTATIFSLVTGKSINTIFQLITFTLLSSYAFLSFVMVTEPKTSPIIPKQQIILGIIGGMLLFIFANYLPHIKTMLEIPEIIALLILNIFTLIFKRRRFFETV